MGRHTATDTRGRQRRAGVAALVVASLVVGAGVTGWSLGWFSDPRAAEAGDVSCDQRTLLRVAVSPDIAPVVTDLLSGLEETCADVAVVPTEPLQAVASITSLEASALPHLWIPDSSLWVSRAGSAPLRPVGNLAASPLVLATNPAASTELGWTAAPPTWGEALTTGRPVAVQDLASTAEGLISLAAVQTSLGGGEAADNAVVNAALAAGRGEVPSAADGLAAAAAGGADAPLVPVTEQEVFSANRGQQSPSLVAVYPSDGSPSLDYPIVAVGSPTGPVDDVVTAAVSTLTSDDARVAVRRAGFRDPSGAAPDGAGPAAGVQEQTPATLTLEPARVTELLARLSSLARPSRLLAVIDVSTSMEAAAGPGQTRITLARDAAKSALALFPEASSIGLWAFASALGDSTDWLELAPVRPISADAGGLTQRQSLAALLDSLPDRLTGGGTSLYDTTLGAVRSVRESYDPGAVNSVVLITDGRNEDSTGIDLLGLLETLQAEADPQRPVKVIAVGLGPDADSEALDQIADATGGAAYAADDPRDLQTVLFDALRRRS
ncbi:MAG TPA: VWA domain-containing protein [Actinomycetales bacterium]|nr:VWA domain-containing protein [Actinomycetales bacterium]